MGMIFVYWGILIGFYLIASRLRRFSDKMSFMGKAMMAAIYVLVFVMGLNMGINEQVTSSLGIIGLQALVITVLSVFGSMLFIFSARKKMKMDKYGNVLGKGEREGEQDTDIKVQQEQEKSSVDIKSTVTIILLVAAGVVIGKFVVADRMPNILDSFSGFIGTALTVFLCILIAIIGFDMGLSGTVVENIKKDGGRVLVFPVAIIAGTFIFGGAATLIFGFSVKEGMAICAGFGWYSYAPAVISAAGAQYAVASAVSFMHNVIRETMGIIFIPILSKKIGYLESIGIPGIGTMDVCMPIVERSCREDTVVYGFVSGFIICIFTSVFVPLIMGV